MTGRVRLVSGCLRAVELLSGVKTLDTDAMIETAVRGTGHTGAALDDIREPLGHFLRACHEEARLSALGRWGTGWDVRRFLSNLLRLRTEEELAPQILDEPVEAPIFITGMPRSGTSFLHRLMAEDPANRAPRCWQTIHPYPESGNRPMKSDGRPERVERQLFWYSALAPEIQSLHPIRSRSPQECTEITAHVFQSLRFDATYEMPSYRRWLDERGHVHAYRFHKRFLQHLQHQGDRGRWVLKSPDHIFALEDLRTVYPDARFVFIHRDPLKVIPSAARLTEVLRSFFAHRADRVGIGRQVIDDWERGCATMIDVKRHRRIPSARVIHLSHSDVVMRPLDAIERIYDHFGLPLTADAVAKMHGAVKRQPRGGYGRHHYRLEAYGISPAEIRERFRDYVHDFDVLLEAEAVKGTAA